MGFGCSDFKIRSVMESEEWESYPSAFIEGKDLKKDLNSEYHTDQDKGALVSLDTILPDDLLEKILSFLSIVGIIRSGSVCKRWNDAVQRYKHTKMVPQKPWYFMFTCGEEAVAGYSYDPSLKKWYNFNFPCIEKSNWSISFSYGLVCLMDSENKSRVFVCNPITKHRRKLPYAPGGNSPDYSALAISVDKECHNYTIVVAKCGQVPEEHHLWNISIHIYFSESDEWFDAFNETLVGWRGCDDCVICDGVLYYLLYSSGYVGHIASRHCLAMYDLSTRPGHFSLMNTAIPAPCTLTCGRLMNLRDRVILVGGIGKQDRPGVIKGIGIWELRDKKEWCEVARMPQKFFQGFGELDEVFASSGCDDLIYIQSYGSPALLTFDVSQKLWKWTVRSPVSKRFPLQLFTGFCFEPRLEIAS
uniref:F-box domain-containing protein n=1 Tax=Ananas comosus var. bracteatus TaxID=296719 RepID=A0A6V7QUS7_ANACO